MSFDTGKAKVGANSETAPGKGGAAAPGKQTQVEKADAQGGGDVSGVNLTTLQAFITKHEGVVDHVYLDSRGFPTAGIGHLLAGNPNFHVGEPVSSEQVTAWFKQDTAKAIAGAKADMGGGYDKLDEARKMVVIDMVFNMGAGSSGFGGFHATIAAMNSGNYAQAASDMLQSAWAGQVGGRATEDASIMRGGALAGGGGTGGAGEGGGKAPSGGGKAAGGTAPSIAVVREGKGALKQGEHGPSVAEIQKLLHVAADGDFGPATKAAVESFQRVHHLSVDGIVGQKTIEALDKPAVKAPAKAKDGDKSGDNSGDKDKAPHTSTGGAPATGGVEAPPKAGGGTPKAPAGAPPAKKGEWTAAPSLDAVKTGTAVLHDGERGPAVKDVQKLLAITTDGEFGPATKSAVAAFQHEHKLARKDGEVDATTLESMTKHPAGSLKGESTDGSAQRTKMLGIARSGSAGKRPDGRCYYHVCQFLIQCHGYGKITDPYTQFPGGDLPEAHDFADLMNAGGSTKFGIDKLSISNPYDAPSGSIVVVAAGSPGTFNPTAGDIAVADGAGNFFNGGLMSYTGRAGWDASPRAKLLGCYVPK